MEKQMNADRVKNPKYFVQASAPKLHPQPQPYRRGALPLGPHSHLPDPPRPPAEEFLISGFDPPLSNS